VARQEAPPHQLGQFVKPWGHRASAFKEKPSNPYKHKCNETNTNIVKDIHRSKDHCFS
jgi:hypothetical protein